MSGDWIKMRASLWTHPKVLRIAGIIGRDDNVAKALAPGYSGCLLALVTRDVTRDVTVASLLRVWSAANEHTDDGVWHGMHPEDLDQIAGVPGFGAAMEEVGWASYDEDKDETIFPNFLEYNTPSKNGARSTSAERQKRYRENRKKGAIILSENECVTQDVTQDVTSNAREEKRRSKHIDAAPKSKSAPKTSIPEDFKPSERTMEWAKEKGYSNIQDRLDHFVTAAKAKGYTYVDWQAAFQNAVRNDWAKINGSDRPSQPTSQISEMFRRAI